MTDTNKSPRRANMSTPSSESAAKQRHLLSVKQQVYRTLVTLVSAMASSVGGPLEAIKIIEKEMENVHADLDKAQQKAARRTRKGSTSER